MLTARGGNAYLGYQGGHGGDISLQSQGSVGIEGVIDVSGGDGRNRGGNGGLVNIAGEAVTFSGYIYADGGQALGFDGEYGYRGGRGGSVNISGNAYAWLQGSISAVGGGFINSDNDGEGYPGSAVGGDGGEIHISSMGSGGYVGINSTAP